MLLSHRKRQRTHTGGVWRRTRIGLLFEFQRLKIGCFKTAVLNNAWPCYRCSPSFRNELLVLSWLVDMSLHAPWWAAYKDRCQIMKSYYRKQCILRTHEMNDGTYYETIDSLFRPSDIYRHIAQPYHLCSQSQFTKVIYSGRFFFFLYDKFNNLKNK